MKINAQAPHERVYVGQEDHITRVVLVDNGE